MTRSGFDFSQPGPGDPHHRHDAPPPPSSDEDSNSVQPASDALSSLQDARQVGMCVQSVCRNTPSKGALQVSPSSLRQVWVLNCIDEELQVCILGPGSLSLSTYWRCKLGHGALSLSLLNHKPGSESPFPGVAGCWSTKFPVVLGTIKPPVAFFTPS